MSRRRFLLFFAWIGAVASGATVAIAKPLRVKTGSWLEVRAMTGEVIHQRGQQRWRAWVGMRFNQVGDGFETGKDSTAVLGLASDMGTLYVGEQTKLTVQRLEKNAEGGIVADLDVPQGQVRLKVRPLTNSASKLEIRTPAGIAGVRGTEFGVGIQPNGQTGIATRSGLVAAAAQGQTVAVAQVTQSLMVPQSPPTPAVPLRDDPGLNLQVARLEGSQVRLTGHIDPVNVLLIEGKPQNTDRQGRFDLLVAQWRGQVVTVQVITPLGNQQRYELPVIT